MILTDMQHMKLVLYSQINFYFSKMRNYFAKYLLKYLFFNFTLILFLVSCTNGKINVTSLSSSRGVVLKDGITLNSNEIKSLALDSFNFSGKCGAKIIKISYQIQTSGAWIDITNNKNSTVQCASKGTFSLSFNETIDKLKTYDGYIAGTNGNNPKLNLKLRGESEKYYTSEISLTVTQQVSKDNNFITPTGLKVVSNSSFKIKGHIVGNNTPQTTISTNQKYKLYSSSANNLNLHTPK